MEKERGGGRHALLLLPPSSAHDSLRVSHSPTS